MTGRFGDSAAGTRKKADPVGTYCATQYLCCIAPKGSLYQFQQRQWRFRPQDGGTRRCHRHGSAPGAGPYDRRIVAPPKDPLYDRGHRDDHIQVQSQGGFASQLMTVKSLSEMVELSTAHTRKHFESLTAQSKELAAIAQKVAVDSAEPVKESFGKVFKKVG